MIEFVNVTKSYGNTIAIDNINFNIQDGEFVFLTGPSGSGKSTIMKLLLKEEQVTSGDVIVNGIDIDEMKEAKVPYYRRDLGVVFQDFKLLPDRTVYENIAFAMNIVHSSPREIKREVSKVLSWVGLEDKAKSLPNQLSGGEQQRIALARAIVNNPKIILADEPTGNLDVNTAHDIFNLLLDLNEKGTTVIVATHAIDIVKQIGKRVIGLNKGKIV